MAKKMILTSLFLASALLLAGQATGQQAQQDQVLVQERSQGTGVSLQLSTATVRLIKQRLNQAGYDPGSINANWDQQTRQAVQNFQQAQGLEPTGSLNYRTLALLGINPPGAAYGPGPRYGGGQVAGQGQYGGEQQGYARGYGGGMGGGMMGGGMMGGGMMQQPDTRGGQGPGWQQQGQYGASPQFGPCPPWSQYREQAQYGRGQYGPGLSQQQYGASPQFGPGQQGSQGQGQRMERNQGSLSQQNQAGSDQSQQQYGVSPGFESDQQNQPGANEQLYGVSPPYGSGRQGGQPQSGATQSNQYDQQGQSGSSQDQQQYGASPQFGNQQESTGSSNQDRNTGEGDSFRPSNENRFFDWFGGGDSNNSGQ